jgi:hypothetical protein
MKIAKYKTEQGWDLSNNIDKNYTLVSSVNTETQDDYTNVMTWVSIVYNCVFDYTKMRDFAKSEFLPNWDNLSLDEKRVLAIHYIYPLTISQQDFDDLITPETQLNVWVKLARDTKTCREKRWEAARRKISFYLTEAQTLDLYLATKDYSVEYKDANIPKLSCWIASSAYAPLGIDFTATGFSQKSYYTTTLRDILLDILINGNYERTI